MSTLIDEEGADQFDQLHARYTEALAELQRTKDELTTAMEVADTAHAMLVKSEATLTEAQAQIAALREQVPRWIALSERLPTIPEGKHAVSVQVAVQCTCGDFENCMDWFVSTASYGKDGTWHFWNMDTDPTHWQSLPAAPSTTNGSEGNG